MSASRNRANVGVWRDLAVREREKMTLLGGQIAHLILK